MKPEKVFRIGLVPGAVFINKVDTENGKREIRNVNLQRRYKDAEGEGEWQSSSSFGRGDIPQAMEVLRLSLNYVAEQEAEVS